MGANIYSENLATLSTLTDEQAGKIICAIALAEQGRDLPAMDALLFAVYALMQGQVNRAEAFRAAQSEKGKAGGRPKSRAKAEQKPEESPVKPSEAETESDTDTNIPPNPPKGEGFAEFWTAYPKKVGKAATEKVWLRINPSPALQEKILATLQTWSNSDQWTKDGGQYIPNPATWLSQGRWEDESPPRRAVSKNPATNYSQRVIRDADFEHFFVNLGE
ncbi:MAG: hypothetical protein FWF10_08670 [Clostridiales bacterium]|nr:hypothetical protein [Clostridiales bacterium]